jgi:PAS domain S-box-containing protein
MTQSPSPASGFALVGADGRFLGVDAALAAILGRSPQQLLTLRWQDLIHPRDLRAAEVAAERVLRTEGSFDQVLRATHAAGPDLILRVMGSVMSGDPPALAIHCEDLTAQLTITAPAERLDEQESAAFLHAVVDAAAEGIIGIDEHDCIRVFSPAAERLYGWTAAEVIGQPVWMLVPAELAGRARGLRDNLAAGRTVEGETVALRKDGTPTPIRLTASPIRGDDGRYRGAAVTVLDLSDQERAQFEVEQSRQLLHHVMEHAPGVVAVKDHEGRYELLNRLGAAMLGKEPADVIGCTDFDLYAEADARLSREEDRRVLETGEPLIVTRDVAFADGEIRPLLITKFPIPGARGARVGVVATDVTEIRRGRVDRARLEALVRAAPDAIVTTDLDARIRSWNPGAERMFGLSAEEAVGQSADILLPAHELARERDLRARINAGEVLTFRLAARRANGEAFPVEASAAPLIGSEGEHLGTVALVRDISDLLEQELELRERAERLERSNADLEAFAYAASHDLQEPLRSIRLAADVLLRSTAERIDDDERGLLGHVETAATRAGAQVDALLRVARVALGQMPQEPVPLDVALQDARNALRAAIRESEAEIDVHGPLPAARVSRAELALLLQNLLTNAIKFRRPEEPPRIDISAAVNGDCVELHVADNGVGMSADDRAHVFAIFGRGRADVPGTGMGLAVVQRMVNRRGGSIAVHSEGPGRGSEFVLRLPAA